MTFKNTADLRKGVRPVRVSLLLGLLAFAAVAGAARVQAAATQSSWKSFSSTICPYTISYPSSWHSLMIHSAGFPFDAFQGSKINNKYGGYYSTNVVIDCSKNGAKLGLKKWANLLYKGYVGAGASVHKPRFSGGKAYIAGHFTHQTAAHGSPYDFQLTIFNRKGMAYSFRLDADHSVWQPSFSIYSHMISSFKTR